jgi:hypothetical protein
MFVGFPTVFDGKNGGLHEPLAVLVFQSGKRDRHFMIRDQTWNLESKR